MVKEAGLIGVVQCKETYYIVVRGNMSDVTLGVKNGLVKCTIPSSTWEK